MVGLGSSKNLQQKTAFFYCPKTHEKNAFPSTEPLEAPQKVGFFCGKECSNFGFQMSSNLASFNTHDASTHEALPPALIAEIDAVHEVG